MRVDQSDLSADGKRLLVTARGKDNPGLQKSITHHSRASAISKPGQEVLSGTYGPFRQLSARPRRVQPPELACSCSSMSGARINGRRPAAGTSIWNSTRRVGFTTKNAQSTLFARDSPAARKRSSLR
jgi:hypothetical protein